MSGPENSKSGCRVGSPAISGIARARRASASGPSPRNNSVYHPPRCAYSSRRNRQKPNRPVFETANSCSNRNSLALDPCLVGISTHCVLRTNDHNLCRVFRGGNVVQQDAGHQQSIRIAHRMKSRRRRARAPAPVHRALPSTSPATLPPNLRLRQPSQIARPSHTPFTAESTRSCSPWTVKGTGRDDPQLHSQPSYCTEEPSGRVKTQVRRPSRQFSRPPGDKQRCGRGLPFPAACSDCSAVR
jgi:hypothetical protein